MAESRDRTSPDPAVGMSPETSAGVVHPLAAVARHILVEAPRLGPVRLVCVDGPTCSGKTTLAGKLAKVLGDVPVVHMDDLYEGWDGLPGVAARLETWLLGPLRTGAPARYRRYDWTAGTFAEWHAVPACPALVVEGVGSAARVVDGHAVCKIWVEAPTETRYARGMVRDDGGFGPYWDTWAAAERRHFTMEQTRDRADLIVDGAPTVAYDPEAEVVVTAWRR
ncbi:uridine kinase [Actinopolymorpha sp. B9G3]|uniref:uridine kinase family protein n=1 Tax=Actinopolymorpha sp. B9G3 TaxID=3158970 RepID=UPI0032D94562